IEELVSCGDTAIQLIPPESDVQICRRSLDVLDDTQSPIAAVQHVGMRIPVELITVTAPAPLFFNPNATSLLAIDVNGTVLGKQSCIADAEEVFLYTAAQPVGIAPEIGVIGVAISIATRQEQAGGRMHHRRRPH